MAVDAEDLREDVSEHEQRLETHDRRITRNENWRMQAVGALKFAAVAIGAAISLFGVLIAAGVV